MATTQQSFLKRILIICALHAKSNTVYFHFVDGFSFQNQTVYWSLSTHRLNSLTVNKLILFVRILRVEIPQRNNGREVFKKKKTV